MPRCGEKFTHDESWFFRRFISIIIYYIYKLVRLFIPVKDRLLLLNIFFNLHIFKTKTHAEYSYQNELALLYSRVEVQAPVSWHQWGPVNTLSLTPNTRCQIVKRWWPSVSRLWRWFNWDWNERTENYRNNCNRDVHHKMSALHMEEERLGWSVLTTLKLESKLGPGKPLLDHPVACFSRKLSLWRDFSRSQPKWRKFANVGGKWWIRTERIQFVL